MESRPRGVALVFVTEPRLEHEGERFRSIYEQLEFKTYLHQRFSRDAIFAELTMMAQSKGKYAGKYKGDAFIMMFIGHGVDEKIIGWLEQPQWPPADDTVLPIRDIVDMFSEKKCRALRQKTKMFIFNCCREKLDEADVQLSGAPPINTGGLCAKCQGPTGETTKVDTLATLDPTWKQQNKQTHVIYACAEGSNAWFQEFPGTAIGHASVFGQAFSHTIAQYAGYKSLYQLICMTVKRSEEESERIYQEFLKTNPSQEELEEMGDPVRRPEIRMFAVDKDVFFNPGLFRDDHDD
ncbi:unnamed protein product [Medioppia subpectinata]|uniref:Caspase family p20 domain-containing protein n=1 Tax=Medioppia subpectinata TaxID=1979941 RepID=A0A7R9L3D2_9ACAR|nr:unnamed protein product [Medioppia subpectinata]CAG2113583.1 unnamed protein product [Medioppia subpectinata]